MPYCLIFMKKVRTGMPMSSAARRCTPSAASSACTMRARFIAALYRAAVVHADGGAVDDLFAQADAAMADATRVVAHRHARLHDPSPARLLQEGDNATVYKYGYLNEADTLCYWVRERALARQQLLGSSDAAPGCALGF